MKSLEVDTPGGRYPIFIGSGAVDRLPSWLRRQGLPSGFHLVSDSVVAALHGERVTSLLEGLGVPTSHTIVPAGEKSKSTRQLEKIWRGAIQAGLDRRGCVVALGGGVVGDLAGMAAATILRGVRFLQVPTSLLAMVDSSVGGKTGINIPEGKNLVGAFFQPQAVFIDLEFLATLPPREVQAGWAEIVKAAAIRDARLFGRLERGVDDLGISPAGGSAGLERVIHAACRIKAEVVGADEREAGLRMILNFGHTLAHGLEAAVGYAGLLHGEAVAIGMSFAGRFGLALGLVSKATASRVPALLKAFGLPVTLPRKYSVTAAKVLGAMERDKKRGPKGLRWVLVPTLGSARIHDDIPIGSARLAVREFLRDGR